MLVADKLQLSYGDELIYKNLSFSVKKGQIIGIKGKNGSGKTSLLLHIANLFIDDVNLSGDVKYDDKNLLNLSQVEFCKTIGIIFQEPESQFFCQTVKSELAFILENLCYEREIIKQKINKITKLCGIEHLIDKKINELSGGEKQLVLIASVLIANPKVLLADEIISRADKSNRKKIEKLIRDYAKIENNIVIYVSHKNEENDFFDKMITLEKGKDYAN